MFASMDKPEVRYAVIKMATKPSLHQLVASFPHRTGVCLYYNNSLLKEPFCLISPHIFSPIIFGHIAYG
jgi:hypothetical protein